MPVTQSDYVPRHRASRPKIWISRFIRSRPEKTYSQREEEVCLSYVDSGGARLDVSMRAPSGLLDRESGQISEQALQRLQRLLAGFRQEWERCPPDPNIP